MTRAGRPPEVPCNLPAARGLRKLLERMEVPAAAVDEIVDARAAVDGAGLTTMLGSRCREILDGTEPPTWPAPAPSDATADRYAQLYPLLAATEPARARHCERGFPEDIFWAGMTNIGVSVTNYRRQHGVYGFDAAAWNAQHLRGQIFRLGRLQFNFGRLDIDPALAHALGRFDRGGPAIAAHIPPTGRLEPSACDASFAWARAFFGEHFADTHFRIVTCGSWLLDEQLAEYLPPDSNIIRFQRRFTVADEPVFPGNDDVLRFVFGQITDRLHELPQWTTMERAAVAHMRAGREWKVRIGWLEL